MIVSIARSIMLISMVRNINAFQFWLPEQEFLMMLWFILCCSTLVGSLAMDRPSKLARLSGLRSRLPHISHSALAALLTIAKEEPLPELTKRDDIRDARDAVALQDTRYGKLIITLTLPGTNGRDVTIPVQNPFAMLWAAAQCKYFARLLATTAERNPPSPTKPWSVCIYSDEITPGNQLKPDNQRKLQGVYWTFLEFGPAALAKEDNWLVVTTSQSVNVKLIQGGMSAVIGAILKMFFSSTSYNLQTAGISVTLHPDSGGVLLRIFGAFKCKLGDEAALHAVWMCKGSSGLKICVECANIMDPAWCAKHKVPDDCFYKPYNKVFTVGSIVRQTHDSIYAIADELREAKPLLGKGKFKEKETYWASHTIQQASSTKKP